MSTLSSICRPAAPEIAEVARLTAGVLAASARFAGARRAVDPCDGGKMLRPATLLLVGKLFDADRAAAVRLALAVELVHAASLIHDDVIDASDTRRGKPTAFRRIGPADAVLLGDVIFTSAFGEVVSLRRHEFTRELARAARDVCAGEVRQNRSRGDFRMTLPRYSRIVTLKTASLYRACAALGALAGGCTAAELAAARRFGHFLGLAFQAADDLLDVTGKPEETGKPAGTDLAQGKVTLPLILHLKALSPRARRAAVAALSSGGDTAVRAVCAALRSARTVSAARRVARAHANAAVAQLDLLPAGPEKKNLAALCAFAADRSY